MTGVLVLHAAGDEAGGGPWAEALVAAGWDGPVLAPDLPGHGWAPPPEGGWYDAADAAFAALPLLAALGDEAPVVVGVGASGWPAWLLALGGRASALVLVDGLGGPWTDLASVVAEQRSVLRALADDEAALAPHVVGTLDPALRHHLPRQRSLALARRAAAATAVATLVLESPASPAGDAAADLVARFPHATSLPLPDATPDAVVPPLLTWSARPVA